MKALKEIEYAPLASPYKFRASLNEGVVTVRNNLDHVLTAQIEMSEETLKIKITDSSVKDFSGLFLIAVEYLLGHFSEIKNVQTQNGHNLVLPFKASGTQDFSREEFFQLPELWHHSATYSITPEKWTETNGRAHPLRSAPHIGTVYKRYVPEIEKTLSFRSIDLEKDLDIFHEWHNQFRVYTFWELNKPKEELKAYIEKSLKDPHQFPMIVEMDNQPIGYYEMYWILEDRLGPYYESEAWDRGFHFLIGDKKALGFANTDSVLKAGLHFLYLDDPRTRKVMAEPRSDNQKVLKYAEAAVGWTKLKEFDFPHKRAALLENRRESFFARNAL